MDGLFIRKAIEDDISFLANAIVVAEKSGTDKLGLATLFNLKEAKVRDHLKLILAEDLEGCEFSLSSFLVAEYNGKLIGAMAGWIEQINETMASKFLKANLITYTFDIESVKFMHANMHVVKGIQIERTKNHLQIEYVYVDELYRGQKIAECLLLEHIKRGISENLVLEKVQVHVFNNNFSAQKLYTRMGFEIVNKFISSDNQTLNFLPFNEKLLMEKRINNG